MSLHPLARLAVVFAASGVVGWLLENMLTPNAGRASGRYSKAFGGARVPFLPVYAAGGALVALAAPAAAALPLPVRGLAYAIGLSGLELAACRLDRSLPGRPSWSYGLSDACVDGPHALAWAGLGLAVEAAVRRTR